MKKNEQLLRVLGRIAPRYVEEAAPGNEPKKARTPYIRIRKRGWIGIIAAMISLSVLLAAMLLPGSAIVPGEGDVEKYELGSALLDCPRMILAEDYEAMLAIMDAKIAEHPEMQQKYERFKSYFCRHSVNATISEKTKEGLLMAYPIAALTDFYAVDVEIKEDEIKFLVYWLMFYAEMTQEDLVQVYSNLHATVDASTLSEEEKAHIHASLPEIPTVPEDTPVIVWASGKRVESTELRITPDQLPSFLTWEQIDRLCTRIDGAKEGKYYELSFILYDLYGDLIRRNSNDSEEVYQRQQAVYEYLRPVALALREKRNEHIYGISPYTTLHQKVMLCYFLSTETDITAQELAAMEAEFYDTVRGLSDTEGEHYVKLCKGLNEKFKP